MKTPTQAAAERSAHARRVRIITVRIYIYIYTIGGSDDRGGGMEVGIVSSSTSYERFAVAQMVEGGAGIAK